MEKHNDNSRDGATKPRRPAAYTEDKLQKGCRIWFDAQYPQYRLLLHHSPNEGLLPANAKDGAKRKAMGVRAGFPDFILLKPSRRHPYLAIEIKTPQGRLSQSQAAYMEAVGRAGGQYVVVRSLEQFIAEVSAYIKDT